MKKISKAVAVRFKQEVRICNERQYLRAFDHPFIVQLYGTHADKRNLYFFLEYLPGGELFTRIQSGHKGRKGLRTSHARFYAAEVILAFQYMHKHRVIYRDLKPENIILDADGHARLVDLGFALQIAYKAWSICGTTEYMAPEMVNGRGASFAVDWWSIGILLYEMLVGRTPFRASSKMACYKRIIQDPVLFPSDFPSRSAKHLIEALLSKDIAARLGSGPAGAEDIKEHPFFYNFDWYACARKELTPPWKPSLKSLSDTRHFVTDGQDFSDPKITLAQLGVDSDDLTMFNDF